MRVRTGLAVAAFSVLLCASVWVLDLFARHEFSTHLRHQAARALAQAATAATPYQWRFRSADDLVAGRPFDAGAFEFVDGGLRIQDQGKPFDVGLPLARTLDLRTFPHFQAAFDADSGGEYRLVTRERPHSQDLLSAPVAFRAGPFDGVIDIAALTWSASGRQQSVPAPRTAAMLRMRFFPSGRGNVLLHSVALQRALDYVPLDLAKTPRIVDANSAPDRTALDVYRVPFAPEIQRADIDAIAARADARLPPLILLPERGRVEQQITLRNAVFAALPAAILIPEAQYRQTFAEARALAQVGIAPTPVSRQWNVVALFALVLLAARIRSPRNPRWRALMEIVLTLAAPAWLIVGGNYDGTLHTPQTVLIGLTVIYAISLSLPRVWHWNGSAEAWLLAGLVVLLALAIGLSLRGAGSHLATPPGIRQVARYIGWALLQQYLVCAVCTERWQVVTNHAWASIYLGALGFALLHTPNAALMIATFIGGLCWCAIYLRHRALLPLAVSHAASALLLSTLLPTEILHSAEVSVRFFQ